MTPRGTRVLIVEDEANIRELVSSHLESEGYECRSAANGRDAMAMVRREPLDAIILDLMLPGVSGLALCRDVRHDGVNQDVPILMLTARADESDKLAGFEAGADDYLTKPFSMLELSARVGALTRRARGRAATPPKAEVLNVAGLKLDPVRKALSVRGTDVPITPHEFRLIYKLASERGAVFSRERLLAEVWNGEVYVTGRSVDTLVHRLRCKIERNPAEPALLLTVWGEGYKLAER